MSGPSRSATADWLIPASLVFLSLVPVIAGAVRLNGLAGGAEITPENARFFADPLPVVLHIVGATVYCLVGAFQFSPAVRRKHPGWHRMAGRVLIPAGLVAALTGMWMTQFYQLPPLDGALLYGMRMVFGAAMAGSIVLGFIAIRRRDFAAHRAWMIRGYALGIAAGTQVFTHVPWMALSMEMDEFSRAMMMGAGWGINAVVAEWIIRRPVA